MSANDPDAEMRPGDEAPEGTSNTGDAVCPDCSGSGQVDGSTCSTCAGSGIVTEGIGGG
jgi:DnaJ-class molecular chaperone